MTAPDIIIIPLKQAGESVTMHVTSCGPLAFGNFPEIEFIGMDGDRPVAVRMPKSSADRQLTRLSLSCETVIGKTVTISRDPNAKDASKPFWGISQYNGPTAAPAPKSPHPAEPVKSSPIIPDAVPDPKLTALLKLHDACFAHALELTLHAKEAGVPVTLDAISALTAQTFIAANDQGIR